MTPKQSRFVEEYLIDCNATQAAKRAGYSAKTAYSIGERLLRNVEVSEAIKKKTAEISTSKTADATEALELLTKILRGEETETIITPSGKTFDVKPKIADRISACDKILKVSGAYKDKIEAKVSFVDEYLKAMEELEIEDQAERLAHGS